MDYVVVRTEGDYAYLRLLDGSSTDELFIALALLPDGVCQRNQKRIFAYCVGQRLSAMESLHQTSFA